MIILFIGLIAGIIGGMGIGGGTILIPALIFLTDLKQQTIQSINLISFIPIAIVALFVHFKNHNIIVKFSLPLIIFGIVGSILGSKLALSIQPESLRKWFGIFLLILGIYEVFFKPSKN